MCNNPTRSRWGTPGQVLRRLLPAAYADAIRGVPRGGMLNMADAEVGNPPVGESCEPTPAKPLPSPRFISLNFNLERSSLNAAASFLVMQVGQFLDHDITLTPESNHRFSCCQHSQAECFPFALPAGDSKLGTTNCFHFSRSLEHCARPGAQRNPLNGNTAFLDLSTVYGSHPSTLSRLRVSQQGLMKITQDGLLPTAGAGDGRFVVTPMLRAMHTVWLREHNRIVKELGKRRSDWGNEELFQVCTQY